MYESIYNAPLLQPKQSRVYYIISYHIISLLLGGSKWY